MTTAPEAAVEAAWLVSLNTDVTKRDIECILEAAAPHMAAQTLREAFHEFPLETITAPDNAVMWLKRRADQIGPT